METNLFVSSGSISLTQVNGFYKLASQGIAEGRTVEHEEEDEVVIVSSYPDRPDTASNEDSDLSWRDDDDADDLGGLDDEDNDHLLIADTTGEFKIKPNFVFFFIQRSGVQIFHHNSSSTIYLRTCTCTPCSSFRRHRRVSRWT